MACFYCGTRITVPRTELLLPWSAVSVLRLQAVKIKFCSPPVTSDFTLAVIAQVLLCHKRLGRVLLYVFWSCGRKHFISRKKLWYAIFWHPLPGTVGGKKMTGLPGMFQTLQTRRLEMVFITQWLLVPFGEEFSQVAKGKFPNRRGNNIDLQVLKSGAV